MGTPNVHDAEPGVHVSEISWTLEPVWPLEDVDLDVFDEAELRGYARHLQDETRWLRRLLHEALAQLQVLTARIEAAVRTIRALRRQERQA